VEPDVSSDLKASVARAYDESADGFAAAAEPTLYRWLAAPLAAALRDVDGPILDVAAGTGALARCLHTDDVVALDLSVRQLAFNPASRRVRADIERLPFAADAFAAAACAFGINHAPDPAIGITEMARVAPVVGLLTWRRPEEPFVPKQIVLDALADATGDARSTTGRLLDAFGDAVGSVAAVFALLRACGLRDDVYEVTVDVPWPGVDAYLDYRLSMMSVPKLDDDGALRRMVAERIAALAPDDLNWRPAVVVGIGRR
jgi:ubiquinone/menaquinone biosynthesis C-methylase UbiE